MLSDRSVGQGSIGFQDPLDAKGRLDFQYSLGVRLVPNVSLVHPLNQSMPTYLTLEEPLNHPDHLALPSIWTYYLKPSLKYLRTFTHPYELDQSVALLSSSIHTTTP